MKPYNFAVNALLAACYVVVTLLLLPYAYGPIQIRFSELFNYTYVCQKKWLIGVAVGVFLSNLVSPLGIIDMFVGTLATICGGLLSFFCYRFTQSLLLRFIATALCNSIVMGIIALELILIYDLPFWTIYGYLFLGQLASMAIGGVIMYTLYRETPLKTFLQCELQEKG